MSLILSDVNVFSVCMQSECRYQLKYHLVIVCLVAVVRRGGGGRAGRRRRVTVRWLPANCTLHAVFGLQPTISAF